MDILLGILLLRSCFDYSFAQALVTIVFIGAYGFTRFLELKETKEEHKDELEKLKGRVDALYLARGVKPSDGRKFF